MRILRNYPLYAFDQNYILYKFLFDDFDYYQYKEIRSRAEVSQDLLQLSVDLEISYLTLKSILELEENQLWIPVNQCVGSDGYIIVRINKKNKLLHRIICEEYYGPCPKNMECRHLDGNRLNYHLSNLKYGTHKENMEDKILHGTVCCGTKSPNSKLKDEDILLIREKIKNGELQKNLAKSYRVAESTISRIVNNKSWISLQKAPKDVK